MSRSFTYLSIWDVLDFQDVVKVDALGPKCRTVAAGGCELPQVSKRCRRLPVRRKNAYSLSGVLLLILLREYQARVWSAGDKMRIDPLIKSSETAFISYRKGK